MKTKSRKQTVRREKFADGSALVTYRDGSVLILESDLARESALQESRPANYNEPPPKPLVERLG